MPLLRYTVETAVPLELSEAWEAFCDPAARHRRPQRRIEYRPDPGGDPLLMQARERVFGLPLRWTEHPAEWVERQRFAWKRVYPRGPLRQLVAGAVFAVDPAGGTRVTFFAEIAPRSAVLKPLIDLLARRTLHRIGSRVAAQLADRQRAPVPLPSILLQRYLPAHGMFEATLLVPAADLQLRSVGTAHELPLPLARGTVGARLVESVYDGRAFDLGRLAIGDGALTVRLINASAASCLIVLERAPARGARSHAS